MNKSTKREAAPLKEVELKARLKKIFPSMSVEFVYSPLKYKHNHSEKVQAEGTFGYHEKESILVDGNPISIAWLPHVKDMSESSLDEIFKRIKVAVEEALVDLDCNADSASTGTG